MSNRRSKLIGSGSSSPQRPAGLIICIALILAGAVFSAVLLQNRRAGSAERRLLAPRALVVPRLLAALAAGNTTLTPADARLINASLPFTRAPVLPPPRFVFRGSKEDRERATSCLAAAAWYEAGDNDDGQKAVVQVVLNRLRHQPFPKTICGVVFEGADRRTGCQFTFVCDGSLARVPSSADWERARRNAQKMLAGSIFSKIGTAINYHADYVVPYWIGELEKVAQVDRHIFYRPPGIWGMPTQLTRRYRGDEQIEVPLFALSLSSPLISFAEARLSPSDLRLAIAVKLPGITAKKLSGNIVRLANVRSGQYVLRLNAAASPDTYAMTAQSLCNNKRGCTVFGWLPGRPIPRKLPVAHAAARTASFYYKGTSGDAPDLAMWNCREIKRDIDSECLPGTIGGYKEAARDPMRRSRKG